MCSCSKQDRRWRAGHGVHRPGHRRARGQRAARALRLLSRDVSLPPAHRHRIGRADPVTARDRNRRSPGDGRRGSCARRCLRRFTSRPASCRWGAVGWRDRLACCAFMRAYGSSAQGRSGTDETVRQWLVRQGQTPSPHRAALGAAGRCGAEPADRRGRGTSLRTRSGRSVRPRPRDSALAIPLKPLDELYALPARQFIEDRGGEVRTRRRSSNPVPGAAGRHERSGD